MAMALPAPGIRGRSGGRGAELHRSPNHGPRRGGLRPDLILIHYTAMDEAGALARLCDPVHEVSAHWFVARDGRTLALVDEARRAWHAGASYWAGERDVNSRSIGIELCNDGASDFPEAQMAALEMLIDGVRGRWAIPAARVLGHSDVAPGRKADPGPRFDWGRLAAAGRAVLPSGGAAAAPDMAAFRAALARIGYDPDAPDDVLLAAFRLRVAPGRSGPLAPGDMGDALEMVARWPGIDGGTACG